MLNIFHYTIFQRIWKGLEALFFYLFAIHNRMLLEMSLDKDKPRMYRDEFLRRFQNICRTRWSRLSSEDMEATIEHVIAADFPESIDILRKMGIEKGFA